MDALGFSGVFTEAVDNCVDSLGRMPANPLCCEALLCVLKISTKIICLKSKA